ncbi:MAG: hypothetical protein AAF298_23385 [Cyanobacteria bacterium P01_A01_bin.40]
MKQLFLSSLLAISFSYSTIPAFAMKAVSLNQTPKPNKITPFSLVAASYQGRLVVQGIPANDAFLSAIRTNSIKAQDLVQGAISSGQLSQDTLKDRDYLDSVTSLLNDLDLR